MSGSTHQRRGGFSFTEILFAVMILGIGFIMIAAMFPVAIHQTDATNQETIAASVGRQASDYMAQMAALPQPLASVAGYTTYTNPAGDPSTFPATPYGILLPTIPSATSLQASNYQLLANQSSRVLAGQVWSLYDSRDAWVYAWNNPNLPSPPYYVNHNQYLWNSVASNLIQPTDPRFAWVAMYRRDMILQGTPTTGGTTATTIVPAPYAQLIMIGVECRDTQVYIPETDVQSPPTGTYPNWTNAPFIPQLITNVTFGYTKGSGISYASFSAASGNLQALGENAYIVISDDHISPSKDPYQLHGTFTGRVFRLGSARSGSNAWNFLPGQDLTSTDINNINAMATSFDVLVVGRRLRSGAVAGAVQDVWAYSTYLPTPN